MNMRFVYPHHLQFGWSNSFVGVNTHRAPFGPCKMRTRPTRRLILKLEPNCAIRKRLACAATQFQTWNSHTIYFKATHRSEPDRMGLLPLRFPRKHLLSGIEAGQIERHAK